MVHYTSAVREWIGSIRFLKKKEENRHKKNNMVSEGLSGPFSSLKNMPEELGVSPIVSAIFITLILISTLRLLCNSFCLPKATFCVDWISLIVHLIILG